MEKEGADRADRTVAALRNSVFGGAVMDSAARQSTESITHGDLLSDAIAAADKEQETQGGDILIRGIGPSQYVLNAVHRINRANLDIVIMTLPFHSTLSLVKWMVGWLQEGKEVELTVRCMTYIIKHHRAQLQCAADARGLFLEAQTIVHQRLREMKSRCGMNLAALKLIAKEIKT
jgi:U3 small nucleolar RNA-associated protein 12